MELSQKMDKKKQHIDSKFIDQSWDNMVELLDKEMPVQKRKRRFIWLWFLGFAAIISVMTYHYSFDTNKNVVPQITPTRVEKIARTETNLINSQNIIKEKSVSTLKPTSETKKLNKNFTEKNNSLQTYNLESFGNTSTKSSTKNIFKLKELALTPLLQEKLKSLGSPKKIQQNTIFPTEIGADYHKWSSHKIASLPLPAFSRFYKERIMEIIPVIKPVSNNNSKWRFGLYAGGLTNNMGSFRAGIHSNLILNPKWTLHIGLGYARRIRNSTISNQENDLADIYTNTDNTGDDIAGTTEAEEEDFPGASTSAPVAGTSMPVQNDPLENFSSQLNFNKLQYFELPILFQYQIKPKWSIDFGGQIALFHGVHLDSGGNSNFTTDLVTFSNATTRSQDLNSRMIKDINFAAIGGISYQITPKLSAHSSYHFSNNYITNTVANSDLEKRWQQIEVGIRYYFK